MSFKESETVELKKSTSELKEGIISIVSMLNKHQKGKLYFGIANNGKVIGQMVTENTLRDISRGISDNIEPKIYPKIKREKIEGKDCISVEFNGNNPPYFAYGRAYMRVADENRLISANELKRMILKNKERLWEASFSDKTLADIDKSLLKKYIQKANEVKRISFGFSNVKSVLTKLNLLKEGKLLKAAEALFCKNVLFEIQCAVFAGTDKLTFLDIKQYNGNIFKLLEESKKYLFEHMNWRAELTGEGRKEIPEVPERAIEEAVVNSLCHRDYSNPKGNEIAFYKDRIEILNPGQFPENLTPEDYIKGDTSSVLRNPLIATTLYYSKDIEKWGSGIKRIYEACREAKIKVEFKNTKTGFAVVFYRPTPIVTPSIKLTEDKTLNERQKRAIVFIVEKGKITTKEYVLLNKTTLITAKRDLLELKKKKIIKFTGPYKTGFYILNDTVNDTVKDTVKNRGYYIKQ